MKLIQEIRLELVSLGPFLLCKYVLEKKNPPSTFIDFINIFHFLRLLQPPRLRYLIFSAPFFTVYKQFNDSFLTEMKLIQEIRLELVSLDPFLLCKYVLRWFLKKKNPPSTQKSTLHVY